MPRTQIYLQDIESAALDEHARKTGRTRSQLSREAIRTQYLGAASPTELVQVLQATAGAWRNRRRSGAQMVQSMRRGRLSKLYAKRV